MSFPSGQFFFFFFVKSLITFARVLLDEKDIENITRFVLFCFASINVRISLLSCTRKFPRTPPLPSPPPLLLYDFLAILIPHHISNKLLRFRNLKLLISIRFQVSVITTERRVGITCHLFKEKKYF